MTNFETIVSRESSVRSYCRAFPAVFAKAKKEFVTDVDGNEYLDFLSGCGSMNYGHNHPVLQEALVNYIGASGISMSMDMMTQAKSHFIKLFSSHILEPRNLDYLIQFPGPTGANSVEAAIKIARKFTGRTNVIAFTNGFHGCSLGALALTGSKYHRESSAALLNQSTHFPYDHYVDGLDTASLLDRMLSDPSSGCDLPAAIILETIQGEGGLNIASALWLEDVQKIAKKHGVILIVDDIQAGCGRSGNFFSFEKYSIQPDIVCLAKGISGFGLPMSLVLLRPQLDIWKPGEHNGTFRGNNHAFVTASASIEEFWSNPVFESKVQDKATYLHQLTTNLGAKYGIKIKGRGLMLGLDLKEGKLAQRVSSQCFSKKLIVETCGPKDEILKLLPPLTVEDDNIKLALSIIEGALLAELAEEGELAVQTL